MKDVVIVSACRTAIGVFGGTLKNSNCAALASVVMKKRSSGRASTRPRSATSASATAWNPGRPERGPHRGAPGGAAGHGAGGNHQPGLHLRMEAAVSGAAMIKAEMADIILAGARSTCRAAPTPSECALGCRLQDTVFQDDMIHRLHGGSFLVPGPESGPVKDGPIIERYRASPTSWGSRPSWWPRCITSAGRRWTRWPCAATTTWSGPPWKGTSRRRSSPSRSPEEGQAPLIFDKDEHFRRN